MAKGHELPSGIRGYEILPNKAPKVVKFSAGNDIQKIELPNWHQDSSTQLEDHLIF